MADHVRCVVWVGRLPTDPDHYWNGCAVALSWTPDGALDNDDGDNFLGAFDAGVSVPDGVGFYVWEGDVEWYDDRGSIPDGDSGCRVWNQSWRPAPALEVWQAQADAKKREALDDDSTPSPAPTVDSGAEPARGEGASARACWDCRHQQGMQCAHLGTLLGQRYADHYRWMHYNVHWTGEPVPGAKDCPGWAPREVSNAE